MLSNSTINAFIELNKLKLARHKRANVNFGKHNNPCPAYKIHTEKVQDSKAQKYLGDVNSEKGKLDETLKQRN